MNRSNHALTGSPGFTFRTSRTEKGYKCEVVGHEHICAEGTTEREAIRAATQSARDAAMTGKIGSTF